MATSRPDGAPAGDRCVLALDAGTTGVRTRAVYADGRPTVAAYREFTQYYPQPGWVEHDAAEIWSVAVATLNEVIGQVGRENVATIGITNQRETVVAWDKQSGVPYGHAIVWQDRRTANRTDELAPHLERVRATTGLVLDPYFSGTKIEWMLANRDITVDDRLAVGTIDSWLIWNLTGGEVHATDVTNASRTMLFDITTREWSAEMCELLNVPIAVLPAVKPSSGRFGLTAQSSGVADGIPVSGVAGDQHAALFGQACFEPGMAKNTYGTGSFVLMNVGDQCPEPAAGMLTTIAWQLADGTVAYALEGAIFVTGAAIQWLRDGLGIIDTAAEVGPLATTVDSTDGVFVVPAFTGLGAPWWDPYARGTITGLTRGSTAAHLARAVVEAMVYQTRDVVDAMVKTSGISIAELRVDGGASVMDFMLQMQADQLNATVQRSADQETTALGAAFLAGLAEGVWDSLADIAATWSFDAAFEPTADRTQTDAIYQQWLRAVERATAWVEPS